MDRDTFERNLLALSRQENGKVCARLSGASLSRGRYRFLESRSGDLVPALNTRDGSAKPLHSLMDPRREAGRLVSTLLGEGRSAEGCLVFFGLGGAWQIGAALEREDLHQVIVVDFDLDGLAELLAEGDYIRIFRDRRLVLLADPGPGELEAELLRLWQPAWQGGIRVIPLRPRVELDEARFLRAQEEVRGAIERLQADYSVQAWFGTRWFSNIIRNVLLSGTEGPPLAPVRRVAVCAAGPSLEDQIPLLAGRRDKPWLLAVDTALPALLAAGLRPDGVISIDCQHISYHHLMGGFPPGAPLFLDLASPPILASLGGGPRFFAGGHPLARHVSGRWRPFPELDTSGANVTSCACSLAEYLGAREIELYGADFSYPLGKTYARGTWLYPWFDQRQNRLAPLESQAGALLFRDPNIEKKGPPGAWYYETPVLRGYREGLEERAARMENPVRAAPGGGAPIRLPAAGGSPAPAPAGTRPAPIRLFSAGKARTGAGEFLSGYREGIRSLPAPGGAMPEYVHGLEPEARRILTTLLPSFAALKRRDPALDGKTLLEAARAHALKELDAVLGA